ncbi:MAG: DNA polymerase III subunit chi [Betaproteobacteria bacterium HGW-Betaproteobacteria-20]|jgi:DNA polymerase-3 subunit chi|nr:MAG: DNA polymerase III subunit chi [Betaproteobacteria bacterium HGW-Betaproteobacteria-20]
MTRVEFFVNVPDKLAKTVELCEKTVRKGRQLTVFTQDEAMSEALRQQLWQYSAPSFLTNAQPNEPTSVFSAIVLDSNGENLLQDDVLINLQSTHPLFFSRFRHLVELVGRDEADKKSARVRYKFYKDRGYEVNTRDMAEDPAT